MLTSRFLALGLLLSLLAVHLPAPAPANSVAGSVFTTQLGFTPGDAKVAALAVPEGTPIQETFRVVEAESDALGYASQAGDVRPYPGGWLGSNAKGDTYLLDFSRFAPETTGRYVVESNGLRSHPFEIGPTVYDVRRDRPLQFFRVQQSAVNVAWQSLDGTIGGHGPDYLDDARQATREDGGGGDPQPIQQDPLALPGGHLDVSGGWYDAGDNNKYMGNTPWAVYLLLLSYEEHKAYWEEVDDNGNGVSDLLDYTLPALEWMLKMRHPDGSVYERVFDGYEGAFDGRPDLDTDGVPGTADDRPLDTDRYADITAKSSYAMAVAYRVFGDQRYLDMAVSAWHWASGHKDQVKPKVQGGGLYFGDLENGLTLGALELYQAQPDPRYLDYASARAREHLAAADWLKCSSWEYQRSYALRRYYDLAANSEEKARILDLLRGHWDAAIARQNGSAYRMDDEWLYARFGQNDLSTSGAGDALWLYEKSTDKAAARKYYDYAVNQLAWVFGRNPFGESWLASARVSEYTRVPHWRATANHPIQGVVVPGATDRDGNRLPDYEDTGKWFYSEPTINQQAMFIRVMASLHSAAKDGVPPPPGDQ